MNNLAFYDQKNLHILGFKRKTIEFFNYLCFDYLCVINNTAGGSLNSIVCQ